MAKNIEPSLKLISGYLKMEKLLLFVVFFLSTNFVLAQNTILWSVKQRNYDKVSYILATFHQMGNSFIDEKPLIKELMSNSKLVIFESIEDKNKNVINVMLRRTDDFSYRELLHKEDVVFLESYTKNWKVPLSKQKPRELIAKLQQEIVKEKCGTIKLTDTSDHMDDYLQQLADKQNVQIFGLESYSDQIDAINNNKEELSWDKAKEIVSLYIVDAKTEEKKRLKQICALSTDYMKMKLDYQLNIKCTENDKMLSNRNERWMPKIKQSIEENSSVFIAVGFYHLFGECGIISQLRKEGYDVKPIKLK